MPAPFRATESIPLLVSKLGPPSLGFAPLPRPRLWDLLSRAVDVTPVTLLSGPPGAGKTVLAASWMLAQDDERRVAWVSLDETDDDPATFWRYLVAALRQAGLGLPRAALPTAAGPGLLAADLLGLPEPVVLIIDNADCLTRRDLCGGLDLLVRYAGTRLRLVLCARADPLLPLHGYRLAGTLTEIRADRLAFTAEETGALLTALGTPVPTEAVAALRTVTEGWAVALRLTADSLARGTAPERLSAELAADDGGLTQYLSAELLDRQPAAVRRFLLRVSVTDQLEPALVSRLTGQPGARRALAALAQANVFIERVSEAPGRYRLHALIREILQAELAARDPGQFAALHRICANWYASAGDLPRAVRHALVVGDGQLAAGLLVDDLAVARALADGVSPEQPPSLPPETTGPDAAVLRAATALARGSAAESADLSVAAAAAADGGERPELRASAAVVCTAAVAEQVPRPPGDPVHAAAGSAEALVVALPEEHSLRAELAAVLAAARATALLHTDADDAALHAALRAALADGRAGGAPRLHARCGGQLALLEALHGRLRNATALAVDSEALADVHRVPESLRSPAAATAIAWAAGEHADLGEVRRWTARAQLRTASSDVTFTSPLLAVMTSWQQRARGERDAAQQALRPVREGSPPPRWVRTPVMTELARSHMADRQRFDDLRLDDLDTVHTEMLRSTAAALGLPGAAPAPPAEPRADLPPAVAVPAHIALACLHAAGGDVRAASAAAERALRQAEPEGLRRPFLDAPPQLRPLLRSHPRLAASAAWLTRVAPVIPLPRRATDEAEGGPPSAQTTAEPLTPPGLSEREREVLQQIADMQSTREIAAALFISENTVRTHVRSVLLKMGVSRRSDAVKRARELRIL